MTYSHIRTVLDIDGIPVTVEYVRERPPLWPLHRDRCTVLDLSIDPLYCRALTINQVEQALSVAKQVIEC